MIGTENAGYTITDAVTIGSDLYVLGYNPHAPAKWVCWVDYGGRGSYNHGIYCENRWQVETALVERLKKALSMRWHT